MFTFRIKYLKGDTNCAADALSRYPILSGEPERSDEDEEELLLTPGQRTHIQNPSSGRWDRAGTILETTAPRQYLVRLDGSGRATIRNRRHLRPLTREPHTQASDDGAAATPDPTPPTQRRPQRSRRAPRHLYDYVLGDTTP
ncbi:hypothetical protein O3P69_014289 [Scylla paramamosain]|uniref:Tick transposon n=1 Tax=Scylla paramamosain TaxID=85552 RepID=A0AAW0TAE7_SCYPA